MVIGYLLYRIPLWLPVKAPPVAHLLSINDRLENSRICYASKPAKI